MITMFSSFRTKEFSCSIPDVAFSMTFTRAKVTVSVSKNGTPVVVFDEFLYPDSRNRVELTDIDRLIEPYALKWLIFQVDVHIEEQQLSGVMSGVVDVIYTNERNLSCSVISCKANIINATAEDFCNSHFLTLLDGPKETAPGWAEYLTYIGTESPSCVVTLENGDTRSMSVPIEISTDEWTLIDCSCANFEVNDRTVVSYTISAGQRSQKFDVNYHCAPDVAPVLMFYNSFGVQEMAYCTGEHQQVSSFDRKQSRFGRLKKSYAIEEKETFKADTGYLTFPMANWWREVFRSSYVELLLIYDGVVSPDRYVPIVITSEKAEMSNEADHMPRFTFEYEYADRNHNVWDARAEGRVFDNTFDNTFN